MNIEDNPLVSVVLINYNGSSDTIECVNSLSQVSYKNLQVIVVDNASTDNSVEILNDSLHHDNLTIIAANENNGFSAGNNIGIREAKKRDSDYVLILNNDTVVEPDFIEPLLAGFNADESVGCVISKILYESQRDKIWYGGGTYNPWFCRAGHVNFNKTDAKQSVLKPVDFASGCCMMLSDDAIQNVGLMDENYFLYVEDTEYSLRLRKSGYKLMYASDSVIYHKVSSSTQAGSDLSQYYTIRNTLYLGKMYSSLLEKISTTFYNMAFYTHKVLTRQYKMKNILAAQMDYHIGILGRSDRF